MDRNKIMRSKKGDRETLLEIFSWKQVTSTAVNKRNLLSRNEEVLSWSVLLIERNCPSLRAHCLILQWFPITWWREKVYSTSQHVDENMYIWSDADLNLRRPRFDINLKWRAKHRCGQTLQVPLQHDRY